MNNSHAYSPYMVWIIAGLTLATIGQLTVWCLHNPSLQGVGWVATVIGGVIAVISRTVFTTMIPATTTRDY